MPETYSRQPNTIIVTIGGASLVELEISQIRHTLCAELLPKPPVEFDAILWRFSAQCSQHDGTWSLRRLTRDNAVYRSANCRTIDLIGRSRIHPLDSSLVSGWLEGCSLILASLSFSPRPTFSLDENNLAAINAASVRFRAPSARRSAVV